MFRSLLVSAGVVVLALAIGAIDNSASGATGTQLRVKELPLGVKVQVSEKDGQEVVVLPFGSVLTASIWQVSQGQSIAVCWENPSAATTAQRDHVRQSVEATWQKESRLRFSGWGPCERASGGIRIRIADEGPHVKALGRYLDARPDGMVLNFTFNRWSPSCQSRPDFCSWAIAVHEFGHAIGFAHEQNRADAPFECQAERQGTTGDWNVTTYDPQSIMNYCNQAWNNDGKLSARDVEAVRTIYGAPQQ